jgi:hypothetical protein
MPHVDLAKFIIAEERRESRKSCTNGLRAGMMTLHATAVL